MCNLYRHELATAEAAAIAKEIGSKFDDRSRGLNIEPGYVGADGDGPVLSVVKGELGIHRRRWGFPPIREGAKPITNIRNLKSSWWRGANREFLMDSPHRCLVPFKAFAEWSVADKENAWFEVDAEMPCFAGIWRPWHGERLKEIEGKKRRQREVDDFELFAFLTTEPCETVAKVHPKAMPVILTTANERARWLSGGEDTLDLQRPLDNGLVKRVK
ncbi:MAG: SOS response-associated peptidase family protein [Pseudomonadota bacterium]